MEVKFTPAPWAFQKFGKDFYLTAQHGMREIILAGSKSGQLRMNQDGILLPINPNHSNAKLICAAPDLLEALLEYKRLYEAIRPTGGWQGVYEMGNYAIKKATE